MMRLITTNCTQPDLSGALFLFLQKKRKKRERKADKAAIKFITQHSNKKVQ